MFFQKLSHLFSKTFTSKFSGEILSLNRLLIVPQNCLASNVIPVPLNRKPKTDWTYDQKQD